MKEEVRDGKRCGTEQKLSLPLALCATTFQLETWRGKRILNMNQAYHIIMSMPLSATNMLCGS